MNKPLAAALVLLSLAAGARAGDADDVKAAIQKLNKAFVKGDAEKLAQMMTDDKVAVTGYYGREMSRDDQMKTLPELKLTEYKAGKMTIRPLGKEAALVTYPLQMKGTYQGKPVPAKSLASAVWVKQGGKWREAYYQETALAGK